MSTNERTPEYVAKLYNDDLNALVEGYRAEVKRLRADADRINASYSGYGGVVDEEAEAREKGVAAGYEAQANVLVECANSLLAIMHKYYHFVEGRDHLLKD